MLQARVNMQPAHAHGVRLCEGQNPDRRVRFFVLSLSFALEMVYSLFGPPLEMDHGSD